MKVSELPDNSYYCALKWNPSGTRIGTGSNVGILEVTDSEKCLPVWSQHCHVGRISSMSWMNPNVVSTGSRDYTIKTFDLRCRDKVTILKRHNQEVCGLKWSPNGIYLASGGNDNIINIWDQRK